MPVGGFPTTTGSIPYTQQEAWTAARSIATQLKVQATSLVAQAQSAGIPANQILGFPQTLNQISTQLTQIAAVGGIAAYAQAQINNSNYNVAAAFTSMQSAVNSLSSWITTNFPVDSGGYLEIVSFSSGTPLYVTFSPSQLTGFVTSLNALLATLD